MKPIINEILVNPHRILELNNHEYARLLSEGRSSRLLASLDSQLKAYDLERSIPSNIYRHFLSARLVHEKQKRDLVYDCDKIQLALNSIGEKLVLLKGAAYLQANLPVGKGRLITDIDILVSHDRIDSAEEVLIKHGWERSLLSAYDDNYYRKWGHEIPPLTNVKRESTLDVHHNILPPTCGPSVNAELLFERLLEVQPGIYTLCLQDMVIHSATHLFHEGEFHHGLRDLWDLDRMLRDFPQRDTKFWSSLVSRARELDLLDSLFHGLNYVQIIFGTPIPEKVNEEASSWRRQALKPMMDFLFLRAFQPNKADSSLPLTGTALGILYVRSHYLRMPLYLLLPHLVRKAWIKKFGNDSLTTARQDARNQDTVKQQHLHRRQ